MKMENAARQLQAESIQAICVTLHKWLMFSRAVVCLFTTRVYKYVGLSGYAVYFNKNSNKNSNKN